VTGRVRAQTLLEFNERSSFERTEMTLVIVPSWIPPLPWTGLDISQPTSAKSSKFKDAFEREKRVPNEARESRASFEQMALSGRTRRDVRFEADLMQ
jgi:hypothetical protein